MFMCKRHWYALRKPMRDAVWREYVPGQERSKTPTLRYLCVQQHAIGEVAFRPHDEQAAAVSAPYLLTALATRLQCLAEGLGDPLEGIVKMPDIGNRGTMTE
jgi:hypothetical protein